MHSDYCQIELDTDTKPKTAFTLGHGQWQFRVMPFSLCNSLATFEHLIERVLVDIPRSHCVVYLDYLLVHASNFDHVLAHLRKVLVHRQAGLQLNPAKCDLL